MRAYHLLERDLYRVLDFVEPADANLKCYSHEIYALFLRASTEFEASARSILVANGYTRPGNWNVKDYSKINKAMRLDEYGVSIPIWRGSHQRFKPFKDWSNGHSLSWYQDYNAVKHDRFANFPNASLESALNAVGAVFCILFAQFHVFAFDPHHPVNMYNVSDSGVFSHDACMLTIEPPNTWLASEQYDFNWNTVGRLNKPFQQYRF